MIYHIYKIECLVNNKKYYGRSQEIKKRWRSHINCLNHNAHPNFYLQQDWNAYGESLFKFEILHEFDDINKSIQKEQEYIDNDSNIYNISNAQNGGDTFTNNPRKEEIRQLKSKIFSGKGNPMYNKEKSELTIRRIKEANSHRISGDGIIYENKTAAAKALNLCTSAICNRVKSDKPQWSHWYRIDYDGNKID